MTSGTTRHRTVGAIRTAPVGLGVAVMLVLSLLAATGCGLAGPAHREPLAPGTAASIKMGFTSFKPDRVTVRVGDTVEWRNTSVIAHTVTADPARAANPDNVVLPRRAEPFHSARIAAGSIFRYTFTIPGTYRYVCLPHEADGMIGTVIVTES